MRATTSPTVVTRHSSSPSFASVAMPFKKRTDCEQRPRRTFGGAREERESAADTRTHTRGGNRLAAQVMTSKGSLTSARQISITATPPRYGNNPFSLSVSSNFLGAGFRKKRRETGGVSGKKIGRGRFWNWGKNGTKLICWSRLRKNFLIRRIGEIFIVFR